MKNYQKLLNEEKDELRLCQEKIDRIYNKFKDAGLYNIPNWYDCDYLFEQRMQCKENISKLENKLNPNNFKIGDEVYCTINSHQFVITGFIKDEEDYLFALGKNSCYKITDLKLMPAKSNMMKSQEGVKINEDWFK